jgi:competence protein ComEA
VHLNSADVTALDALPGVGPATAQRILDWRDVHGGFKTVDDLMEVPGIGPSKFEALRDFVAP